MWEVHIGDTVKLLTPDAQCINGELATVTKVNKNGQIEVILDIDAQEDIHGIDIPYYVLDDEEYRKLRNEEQFMEGFMVGLTSAGTSCDYKQGSSAHEQWWLGFKKAKSLGAKGAYKIVSDLHKKFGNNT